jgi:hypothetical protein
MTLESRITGQKLQDAQALARRFLEGTDTTETLAKYADNYGMMPEEMEALMYEQIARFKASHAANIKRNYAQWQESTFTKKNEDGSWKYRDKGESFSKFWKRFDLADLDPVDAFIPPKAHWEK